MHPYPPPPPPPKSNVLWIVLAIVGGVLAVAVLILIFTARSTQYLKKSKHSEAEVNLDAIKKAVKAQIPDNAGFIEASIPLTPSESCCYAHSPDMKCQPDPSLWSGTDWDKLDFEIDEPHLFRYAYEGTAEHFEAIAVGDLDCDATEVTYRLIGDYNDGNPTFTVLRPARAD